MHIQKSSPIATIFLQVPKQFRIKQRKKADPLLNLPLPTKDFADINSLRQVESQCVKNKNIHFECGFSTKKGAILQMEIFNLTDIGLMQAI